MEKCQRRTTLERVNDVFRTLGEVRIIERHGGKFCFRMHMTPAMAAVPIEELDLKVRAYNSLKRPGYNTVGDVANAIASGTELSKIRNCGKTSVQEIMLTLFLFQYNSLPSCKQYDYLFETLLMNKKDLLPCTDAAGAIS